MKEQLDIFEEGARLRDQGIARAVNHADEVNSGWSEAAYIFLNQYIRTHSTFLAEDVREAATGIIPAPPHARAWAAIVLRAAKAGLITKTGYASVKNPKAHRAPVTVWMTKT